MRKASSRSVLAAEAEAPFVWRAVPAHCARAITQRRHKSSLYSGSKDGLQPFRDAEKIERFHITRIASQTRFGELLCYSGPVTKLLHQMRISLLVTGIERLRTVER